MSETNFNSSRVTREEKNRNSSVSEEKKGFVWSIKLKRVFTINWLNVIWFYVRVCAVCERTNEFTIIWIANFKTSLSQCEKKGSHDFKWLLLLLEICWTCKFFILTFLNRIRLETIALQINFQNRHNKFYCSRLSWLHFYSFFFLCSFECFCLCTISSDSFKNRLYVHFTQTNLSIAIYKFEQFDNGKHHQSKKKWSNSLWISFK